MTNQTALQKLKTLLGLETDQYDDKLALVWDLLAAQVLTYLGWQNNDLPQGLEAVILQMAMDYLLQNNMGIAIQNTAAKSVKRGDTEITYNVADAVSAASFIRLYNDLLYPFKRAVMR